MRRTINQQVDLIGPLEELVAVFRADPGRWLPDPARWCASDTWTVELHGAGLHRLVSCTVGSPWCVEEVWWRSLTWVPLDERSETLPAAQALPSLRAELGVDTRLPAHPVLLLRGSYVPPAGAFGQLLDSALLHRVARSTVERFLAETARGLVVGRPQRPDSAAPKVPEEAGPRT